MSCGRIKHPTLARPGEIKSRNSALDEFSIIRNFFRSQVVSRGDVVVGIGDDAAVLEPRTSEHLVCTADLLVDGVHFPESTDPIAIGYKSLAVNLSDLAAMGAEPAWATLMLSLPVADTHWIDGFSAGFFELAEMHKVQLIGGDLTRGPLSIGVQAMGYVQPGKGVLRSGAQEGDDIFVSGFLGDANLGLKAVQEVDSFFDDAERAEITRSLEYPKPRLLLGRSLAGTVNAMIDVSDGLHADIGHIASCSEVGANIFVEEIPLSRVYMNHFDQIGWGPALSGGDDYELCFTVSPGRDEEVFTIAQRTGVPVRKVGAIVADGGVRVFHRDDEIEVDKIGYNHFD